MKTTLLPLVVLTMVSATSFAASEKPKDSRLVLDASDTRVMDIEDDIDDVAKKAEKIAPGFGAAISQCVIDVIDDAEPTAA